MKSGMDTRGIDGLRGIAAIGIAWFAHYYFLVPDDTFPFYNGITHWLWYFSTYFVDLFFVISGFVMVYAYREKIVKGQVSFTEFVKKRLMRFYPLMVFSLICVVILQEVHKVTAGVVFKDVLIADNSVLAFLLNLLCLQGTSLVSSSFNAPSWYLSIVLIMYILFFVVTYFAGKYGKEKIAYFLMMILGITLAIKAYPTIFLNCRGVTGFFAGCVLYEVCDRVCNITDNKKKNIVTWTALVALLVICAIGIKEGHGVFASSNQVIVVYGIFIWPMCVFLAVCMPWVKWILSRRIFLFLGKISFSMYLIHYPVMILMDNINIACNLGIHYEGRKAFVLYVAMVMVISILCYYFVEKKLDKLVKGTFNEKKL